MEIIIDKDKLEKVRRDSEEVEKILFGVDKEVEKNNDR